MRADDAGCIWPFDTEDAHALVEKYRALEIARHEVIEAQKIVQQAVVEERIAQCVDLLDPLVTENLLTLMDEYRAVLKREGMAWQGTIDVGVLSLWANDMHGNHQDKGTPWCFISGVSEILWRDDTGTMRSSPSVVPVQVQHYAEGAGLSGECWGAQLHMRSGVSLVVHALVRREYGDVLVRT